MQIRGINFSQEVLGLFKNQISKFGLLETGGVLMGFVEDEIIWVQKASDGGPKAIHEEFYFRADPDYIDMFIDMEYANSKSKLRYLGEWHTHPQIEPEPSELDLNSLEEIAESSKDFAVLVILGSVNYSSENFITHSIPIFKHKDSDDFFALNIQ